jgi:site-specific DNA-methyltransferase (adenine-specific)
MITIHNDDCFNIFPTIADDSVDLILCDLPYGTTDRYGKNQSRILPWDTVLPLDKLWEQYRRIINKDHGVIALTADQPFSSQLVMSNIEWFKYEWIWKKGKATGFLLANYRPMKLTEDILIFSPCGASAASKKANNAMTYNPQNLVPKNVKKKNNPKRLGNFLNQPTFMGGNNQLLGNTTYEQKYTNYPTEILEINIENGHIHPTQKPVALMEYLIATYSNEGHTVLDNCMGSGTTGVACKKMGRKFIGIEISEEYYNIAQERINTTPTSNNQFF